MKRVKAAALLAISLFCVVAIAATTKAYLDHWTFMNPTDAEKRWGNHQFSIESFRTSPFGERAAQSADLVRRQALVGKTADEVVQLLGARSGYFWSDRFPTYFIEEGWTKKRTLGSSFFF